MFYSKKLCLLSLMLQQRKTIKKKEIYDNRIQFFKEHIELRKTSEYYDGVDINFTNLLEAWSS